MCKQCDELQKQIAQYQRFLAQNLDPLTNERMKAAVLELEKRRAEVHQRNLMIIYQEKIAPPCPLPDFVEPPEVLALNRTVASLQRENSWLKARVDRLLGK
jgi:hypothetical protein